MANASPSPDPLRQELDRLCKSVLSIDGGLVLPLLFTPALLRRLRLPPDAIPVLIEQLDKEFSRRRLRADYLLRLRLLTEDLLNHWEFQKFADPRMVVRIAGYQAASFERYCQRVLSFVINISTTSPHPARVISQPLGPLSRTGWVVFSLPALVRTWPAELKSPMGIVLRCLAGEVRQGLLLRCHQELAALGLDWPTCREMVEMLAFLLDRKDGGDGSRYLEILREDLAMLQAEDSLFYRYGVEKGVEKGIEKGIEKERAENLQRLRERAIRLCQQRFAGDEHGLVLLGERLHQVKDADPLTDFLLLLPTAATLEEALSALPLPPVNGHPHGSR